MMKLLHNQRVLIKILCIFSIILLFTFLVGLVSLYSSRQITTLMKDMYEDRTIPIELMDEVRLTSKDTELKLLQIILTVNPSQQQELVKQIAENTEKINKLQEKYHALPLDEFQQKKWEEIQSSLAAYRQVRSDIIKLASSGKQQEAFALYTANKGVFDKTLVPRKDIVDYNVKKGAEMYEEGNRVAASSNFTILGVTLLAVLCSALLGMLLTKAISFPLRRMRAAIEGMAGGDFQNHPSTFVSKDEFGQLADTIVKMRSDLRHLVSQIRNSSELVAASSEELTATVEHSSHNAQQAASAIQDIAKGAENQVTSVTNASSVIENMSSSIRQISSTTRNVNTAAESTSHTATEGLDAVNRVVKQMNAIEQTVDHSAGIVTALGERSKDIGQIVETIAGIAGQTNLLALNAAIEAARAGEQGKGFAVVAEEVRKLAEQSEGAAKQIASLIQETRNDTEKAVQAMQKGSQEVKTGSQVVSAAGQTFQQIADAVNKISSQIKEVSTALDSLSTNSEVVVADIRKITGIADKASEQTHTAAGATEEQSTSLKEIYEASRSLAHLAEELQGLVVHFKT